MFCRYDHVFFFSWLFKTPSVSSKKASHTIYRRLVEGFYLFITWSKARILYYANNWIYTTNHKRIAVNYFWFVILSGIFGMVLATVIRLELAYPGVGIFAGDSLQYLSLATAHGVIMVFFMIIPLISGAFANFLLPTQLGVHDVAFPRLNSAAFWFLPGGLMMLGQLICLDRRYQRMNCFNIREAQSLLKKRFFYDLLNSVDHHTLLDKTIIGLRYKTNDLTSIKHGINLYSNYNLSFLFKTRTPDLIAGNKTHYIFSYFPTFYFNIFNYFLTSSIFQLIFNFFLTIQINIQSSLFFKNNLTLLVTNIVNVEKHFFYFSMISTFKFFLNTLITKINNYLALIFQFLSELKIIIHFIGKHIYYFYYHSAKYLYTTFRNAKGYVFPTISWDFFHLSPFLELTESSRVLWPQPLSRTQLPFFFNLKTKIFEYFILFCKNLIVFGQNLEFIFRDKILFNLRLMFKIFSIEFYDWRINFWLIQLNFRLRFSLLYYYFFDFTRDLNCVYYETHRSFNSIYNSVVDYWGATTTVVKKSVDFFIEFLKDEKNFIIFWHKNRDYSNFLSVWYFPMILSNDELKIKNLIFYVTNNHYFLFDFFFYWKLLIFKFLNNHDYNYLFWNFFTKKLPFFIDNLLYFIDFNASYFANQINFSLGYSYNFDLIKNYTNKFYTIFQQLYEIKISNQFSTSTIVFTQPILNFKNEKLYDSKENNLHVRNLRFNNPVFAYDYKTGNYFPKFYQDNLTYLLSTLGKLTGGVRTPTWFLAVATHEAFEKDVKSFFENTATLKVSKHLLINIRKENRASPSYFFYNFFEIFTKRKNLFFSKKINFSHLTEKFENMFTHVSMQERLYANWRQLKFTREAWRCKLLIARHQKSLFRRYIHESGVFWAIERNARDLLPGWAMITPFSSRSRFTAIGKVDVGVSAILLVLVSSIISGANFLVTYRYLSTLNNRKMRDARSFFTEGIMCSSWMMIAANPMLIIGLIMLLCDRHWQTSFFDYSGGGDTILFQHMFWFFGHPEVYIVIIPTFGFVNTLFSYYLRKRISARASLLYSIYTIAFLGFFVWGHHMYMVGLSHTTRMLFSTLTVMISVPAATKLMHWCVTLVNSSFTVELPFLFMLTYVFLFVSGGISGMCVAHTGMDILFHDTFYVIGHFHVMFAGAAMFGSFGAFYFYFSAIFGVKYSRVYAYMHFIYYLLGQLLTVIPMFWLGYAGMPRRVLDYPSAFGGWHSIITAGHMLSVAGLIAFFMMIFDSLRQARGATRTNLGIMRYNTRINFYFYETARISFVQQKGSYLYRYFRPTSFKLNGFHYSNYEYLETTLFSYTFIQRKKNVK